MPYSSNIHLTKDEFYELLVKKAQATNSIPTRDEVDADEDMPMANSYAYHFGSFAKAIDQLKLDIRRGKISGDFGLEVSAARILPTATKPKLIEEQSKEDAAEEEVRTAALAVLMDCLPQDECEGDEENADDVTENDEEAEEVTVPSRDMDIMIRTRRMVQEFIKDEGWSYSTRLLRKNIVILEFMCVVSANRLRVRIDIEAVPNVCRIAAYLPISADLTYAAPLSRFLAKENYHKRFGCFKYDERDGEICYEYSVLTDFGFSKYLSAVIGSASSAYQKIRSEAVGKYTKTRSDEIKSACKMLLEELDGSCSE